MIADDGAVAQTKTCPECAEEVKAAARICRFCSYRFGTPATAPTLSSPQVEDGPASRMHPVAVALVLAGALALVVGLLLPYAETPAAFSSIEKNTVLQHGEWQYLVGAIVALGFLYWAWRTGSRARSWRIVWAAGVMLAWSIYDLADKTSRTYGYLDSSGNVIHGSPSIVASPGAGLYVATLGSVLILAGGLLIIFPSLLPRDDKLQS